MSMKSEAKRSVFSANNTLGGAKSTRAQRRSHCTAFIEYCAANGMPLISMKKVTLLHIRSYLTARGLNNNNEENKNGEKPITRQEFAADFFRKTGMKPVTNGTLHNILGSIRRSMRALKVDPDALEITAKNLGLPPKSRVGKKLPIPDTLFFAAIEKARALGEEGLAIALQIERYFGHRGLEALMSVEELKKFALEASNLIHGNLMPVCVTKGTKGGKSRVTMTIVKYARESLAVIADAMRYMQSHAFLVEGKSTGLKAARKRYHALARKVGLTGQYSPHSLRYRHCTDKLEELRDAGVSRGEAMKLCAVWLGHGVGRGRFVSMVYGRTVNFPAAQSKTRTRRRRDFRTAADMVDALMQQAFPGWVPPALGGDIDQMARSERVAITDAVAKLVDHDTDHTISAYLSTFRPIANTGDIGPQVGSTLVINLEKNMFATVHANPAPIRAKDDSYRLQSKEERSATSITCVLEVPWVDEHEHMDVASFVQRYPYLGEKIQQILTVVGLGEFTATTKGEK